MINKICAFFRKLFHYDHVFGYDEKGKLFCITCATMKEMKKVKA